MKANQKNTVFVCQLSDDNIKVVKYIAGNRSKRFISDLWAEELPPGASDKDTAAILSDVLKKAGYHDQQIEVSLPRSKATLRYIKVPAQIPQEIEKITSLQASRYLPYPIEELVTGYQTISTDKEGYSYINLIIAHKDVVERYVNIFKELKIENFSITLGSYGLVNLFNQIRPEEEKTVMLLDIDYHQAELAVISQKKLLFSRYFKIDILKDGEEELLIDQIKVTREAYLKEIGADAPDHLLILGAESVYKKIAEALSGAIGLAVEVVPYNEIKAVREVSGRILESRYSFANLMGFGLKDVEASLNLLPQNIKERRQAAYLRKEYLRLALFISLAIVFLVLGIYRNMENKALYLGRLKAQINEVSKEARFLETLEKKLKVIAARSATRLSDLDLLYELYQIVPDNISLSRLSYEEAGHMVLSGQATELNLVFTFVEKLEKSEAFKYFSVKVKYATQKRVSSGDIIDFEITCDKR